MSAENRLKIELTNIMRDPIEGFSAVPIGDDIFMWQATIIGPKESPYEDGIFKLLIEAPDEYPFKPLKIGFITKIFHPNISYTGSICLDILKNEWSSALTISKVLLSISCLMCNPNPDDPLVEEIAVMYKNKYDEYVKTARAWTHRYAKDESEV